MSWFGLCKALSVALKIPILDPARYQEWYTDSVHAAVESSAGPRENPSEELKTRRGTRMNRINRLSKPNMVADLCPVAIDAGSGVTSLDNELREGGIVFQHIGFLLGRLE